MLLVHLFVYFASVNLCPFFFAAARDCGILWTFIIIIIIFCKCGREEETDILIVRLDTTTTRYKIEFVFEKTTVMPPSPNGCDKKTVARSIEEL